MSQLEVPNISFTHYLDLLKRRTWHVVSISIVGLIVGGVVAMMIPRYYVAYTTVMFNRPVLDNKLGSKDDPMARVVREAQYTVSREVENAVHALKWPEALSGTRDSQRAFIAGVRKRVGVRDVGIQSRERLTAELRIHYSDTSGTRAADLANMLRDLWLKKHVDDLKRKAEEDVNVVMREKQKIQAQRVHMAGRVAAFERLKGIDPQGNVGPEAEPLVKKTLGEQIRELEGKLEEEEDRVRELEAEIRDNESRLEGMNPTEAVNPKKRFADPLLQREYEDLKKTVADLVLYLQAVAPSHPQYPGKLLALKLAKDKLAQMEEAGGDQQTRPNPKYVNLEEKIRGLKRTLANKKQRIVNDKKRLGKKRLRFAELPEIYREYKLLRSQLKHFDDQDVLLNKELADKSRVQRLIRVEDNYQVLQKAFVPQRPTDPNPYLQALIGCVVGLGVAIGLVLVLDFLQMTYKSVSDVEVGLGLPVLGSMSYLETDSEIFETRDRRAKLGLFATACLVLALTVIAIYYVSPTRLPGPVTEFLDFLLGDPK